MPSGGGKDYGSLLPNVGSSYCDEASRNELNAYFEQKASQFTGAPRALAQTIEGIDLCIADKAAEEPGVAAFLAKY